MRDINTTAIATDMVTKAPMMPPPPPNPWDLAFGGGLTSDYEFRGITQSAHNPSVTAYFGGGRKGAALALLRPCRGDTVRLCMLVEDVREASHSGAVFTMKLPVPADAHKLSTAA
jgi:hypothetical protein